LLVFVSFGQSPFAILALATSPCHLPVCQITHHVRVKRLLELLLQVPNIGSLQLKSRLLIGPLHIPKGNQSQSGFAAPKPDRKGLTARQRQQQATGRRTLYTLMASTSESKKPRARKTTPRSRAKKSPTEKKPATPRRRASPRNRKAQGTEQEQNKKQNQAEGQTQAQEEKEPPIVKKEETQQEKKSETDPKQEVELAPAQDTQLRRSYLQRLWGSNTATSDKGGNADHFAFL
jgi:hypothetical protein